MNLKIPHAMYGISLWDCNNYIQYTHVWCEKYANVYIYRMYTSKNVKEKYNFRKYKLQLNYW